MSTNGSDRYAIIPLYKDQSPPSNAIMWGGMKPVTEFLRMNEVRNSALNAISRATAELAEREEDLRTRQLQLLCTALDALTQRFDAYEERLAARIKADEEAQAREIQSKIDALEDPDASYLPAHGHFNSGDLSPLPPTVDSDVLPEHFNREAPMASGPLEDPAELGYPSTPKQRSPAAISLNSDDDTDDEGSPLLGTSTPPGRVGY